MYKYIYIYTHTLTHTHTVNARKKIKLKTIPEVSRVLPHMHIKIVFPFGYIAALSTHEVLVVRVSKHMF